MLFSSSSCRCCFSISSCCFSVHVFAVFSAGIAVVAALAEVSVVVAVVIVVLQNYSNLMVACSSKMLPKSTVSGRFGEGGASHFSACFAEDGPLRACLLYSLIVLSKL